MLLTPLLRNCAVLLLLGTGMHSTDVQAAAKKKKKTKKKITSVCGKVEVDMKAVHLDWFHADAGLLKKNDSLSLPKTFGVFTTEQSQLKQFFHAAKEQPQKTVVPLPSPAGCQLFNLRRSGTMSDALAAKYPDMVSLSGSSAESGGNDVRLDFDGKNMRGQILWKEETFLIEPVVSGGKTYYIIYKKTDAGTDKQPFESNTK